MSLSGLVAVSMWLWADTKASVALFLR